MAESRLLVVARTWEGLGLAGFGEANPLLNNMTASELNAAFLEDTFGTGRSLYHIWGIRTTVGEPAVEGDTFGKRIARIFADGFASGADSICVVGTSAPHLPAAFILEAFGRLTQHRDSIVLGPTDSGRLYLIGASRTDPCPLLKEISWDTDNVLTETLQRAVENELSTSLLPSLMVVEAEDCLRQLSRDMRRGVAVAPQTQNIVRKLRLE